LSYFSNTQTNSVKKHNLLGGGKNVSSETRPSVTIRHSALSTPRLLLWLFMAMGPSDHHELR